MVLIELKLLLKALNSFLGSVCLILQVFDLCDLETVFVEAFKQESFLLFQIVELRLIQVRLGEKIT